MASVTEMKITTFLTDPGKLFLIALLQAVTAAVSANTQSYNKDRHFTLFVIDDQNTKW